MNNFLLILLFGFYMGTGSVSAQDKLPWLHTEGERIVDDQGKTVNLRGINLGSWLVEEMWMMPFETNPPEKSQFKKINDHVSLWKTFEIRFGKTGAVEIRKAFRNTWLTDTDFGKIKAAGLNCVRLPFIHDLMGQPDGLFPWLDRVIDAASKQGIYVILDMHGAPGRQSDSQHTGHEKSCKLFKDLALVQKTAELWAKISERYKNRSAVAGYDLLNEPMGAPNTPTLSLVHDQIYRAIRKIDTKHIVFIEDGFKGIDHMPHPAIAGWNNIVLSTHSYPHPAKTAEEYVANLDKFMEKLGTQSKILKAPIYIGEFNVEPFGNAETIRKIITTLESKDMSWSFWTYKKVSGKKGKASMWSLYAPKEKIKRINPFLDTKEKVLKRIKQLHTDNFEVNKALQEVFQQTRELLKPQTNGAGSGSAASGPATQPPLPLPVPKSAGNKPAKSQKKQ
jgi:endoglucanase